MLSPEDMLILRPGDCVVLDELTSAGFGIQHTGIVTLIQPERGRVKIRVTFNDTNASVIALWFSPQNISKLDWVIYGQA